jgi:hypothetical protein
MRVLDATPSRDQWIDIISHLINAVQGQPSYMRKKVRVVPHHLTRVSLKDLNDDPRTADRTPGTAD